MNIDLSILEKRRVRIASHLLFWIVIVASLTIVFGIKHEQYLVAFQDTLLYLPTEALFTYVTLYLLIPKYLLKGRVGSFFVGVFLLFIFSGLLARMVQHFIINPWHHPYYASFPFFYLEKILRNLVVPMAIAGLASSIKLFKLWAKDNQDKLKLEQEKLEAELNFLKAQIHPHFLFNTLNNLYSFTLRNSRESPNIVLKLSELLHYMLYDCKANLVPLEKEIESIKTYIELEKLRYGDKVDISISVNGQTDSLLIAPLLLIPFVENCFTHGVSDALDKSWISLDFNVEQHQLHLKIVNSVNHSASGNGKESIGLENVRKRLNLIYPEKHRLQIKSEEDTWLISLQLDLTEQKEETYAH